MKKLIILPLAICISMVASAKKGGSPSVNNTQVVKSQSGQKKAARNFSTNRRYSALSKGGHGISKKKGGNL
jgi:hypothetical protein